MGKRIEKVIFHTWWTVLFVLSCGFLYERQLATLNVDFAKLHRQHGDLQRDHAEALALNADLLRQVNSQSDPEWVELTLMKGLGLVPDGHVKVILKR